MYTVPPWPFVIARRQKPLAASSTKGCRFFKKKECLFGRKGDGPIRSEVMEQFTLSRCWLPNNKIHYIPIVVVAAFVVCIYVRIRSVISHRESKNTFITSTCDTCGLCCECILVLPSSCGAKQVHSTDGMNNF